MGGGWEVQAREMAPQLLGMLQMWRNSSRVPNRRELMARLGCSDRALRAAIAELRKQGHLIIVDQNGGYRFARDAVEVYEFTASLKSRIEALQAVIQRMDREAKLQFREQPDKTQMALF